MLKGFRRVTLANQISIQMVHFLRQDFHGLSDPNAPRQVQVGTNLTTFRNTVDKANSLRIKCLKTKVICLSVLLAKYFFPA